MIVNKKISLALKLLRFFFGGVLMIISISVSIVGFLIAFRLLRAVVREFFIPKSIQVLWTSTLIFVIPIFSYFLLNRPIILWIGLFLLTVLLLILPKLIRFFLEKRLKDFMMPFLDEVTLNIQQGKSLRNSIEQAVSRQKGFFKSQVYELYNSIVFPDSKTKFRSPFLKKICQDLIEIDRSQTKCLDQIRMLRRQLKIQENFRRRSGQVSQQAKTQAAILGFLQMALTIFVIVNFGWRENLLLLLTSTFLFLLGAALIFWIGRLPPWKI